MNETLEGHKSRFWKNILRPKHTDPVQSVQSYRFARHPATSTKRLSSANTAVDSVANATPNPARHSETIPSRRMQNRKRKEDEKHADKENNSKPPSANESRIRKTSPRDSDQ